MFRLLVLLLIAIAVLSCNREQGTSHTQRSPKPDPQFEDYPIAPVYSGPIADLKLDTPDKRNYRTALRHAASRGVQFAGHYAVASWGCGSNCQFHAIIDVKSGAVYMTNLQTWLEVEYRVNSRLFIKNRPELARQNCMEGAAFEPISWYYEWTGTQLRLIDSVYHCPS